MRCPECGRVASVAPWVKRPICLHTFAANVPEVWDGDDHDGEGHPIEWAPNPVYRKPGPRTWTEMVPYDRRRFKFLRRTKENG